MPFRVSSPGFADGAEIPPQYTCDGADAPPPLTLLEPPAGVGSYAVIMDDPMRRAARSLIGSRTTFQPTASSIRLAARRFGTISDATVRRALPAAGSWPAPLSLHGLRGGCEGTPDRRESKGGPGTSARGARRGNSEADRQLRADTLTFSGGGTS